MRYGLQFVDDPFGPQVDVGVQLLEEPAIVVPPAAECPPCVPGFIRWSVSLLLYDFSEPVYTSALYPCGDDETAPVGPVFFADAADYSAAIVAITFVPILERCGHSIRIVGIVPAYEVGAAGDVIGLRENDKIAFNLTIGGPNGTGGLLQTQIDLTDAEPGFETWTDIGCPIAIFGPTA